MKENVVEKKDNKKRSLILLLIVVMLISLTGFTFAYFAAQLSGDNKTEVIVTSKVQTSLVFNNGETLEFIAGIDNFYDGAGNISHTTNPSVTLMSPEEVTEVYSVYLDITSNDFEYSGDDAELIVTILDENLNEVTEIEGLEYVTVGEVSGFDVTTKNGVYNVIVDTEIETSETTVHTWTFKLTFVNLEEDQAANSSKLFEAEVIMQQGEFVIDGDDDSSSLDDDLSEDGIVEE